MKPLASLFATPLPMGVRVGYCSNNGTGRYLLEAESTSGFVAWRLADGTTLVSEAQQVSLPASPAAAFWACAGYTDTSPAGRIVSFDGHGNALTRLDIGALSELEFLDCSFNALTRLDLANLAALQALDVDDNRLRTLQVRPLKALRVLNCRNNRLTTLDLSGLDLLEILDYSGNPMTSLNLAGCTSLREAQPRAAT